MTALRTRTLAALLAMAALLTSCLKEAEQADTPTEPNSQKQAPEVQNPGQADPNEAGSGDGDAEGTGTTGAENTDAGDTDAEAKDDIAYVRRMGKGQDERLETAVAKFVRKSDGVTVDLIAEMHIADPKHYEAVQKQLGTYEATLYELIFDPANGLPDANAKPSGALSMVQNLMGRTLDLAFQLQQLDYEQDNFVHADFTPAEFSKAMDDGGKTPMMIAMEVLSKSLSGQNMELPIKGIDMVKAVKSGNKGLGWRLLTSYVMTDLKSVSGGMPMDDILLDGRNRKAVEVLQREIDAGKKSFGIHYGAAHMPGIEKILIEELGFERAGVDYLFAWDLSHDPASDPRIY